MEHVIVQMANSWILRDSMVTGVLIGASKVSQLESNIQALDNFLFSKAELNKIDDILNDE